MEIFTSATKEVVTKLREGKLSNNKLIKLELNMCTITSNVLLILYISFAYCVHSMPLTPSNSP